MERESGNLALFVLGVTSIWEQIMSHHRTAYRFLFTLTLLALIAGLSAFGAVGRVSAGGALGPRQVMTAYYAAINARDYATAYSLWIRPMQTYANFVAGYATTASAQAFFGGLQTGYPGSTTGYLPAFLVGTHFDGTQEIYQGCYTMTYNPAESGIRSWLIAGARTWRIAALPTGTTLADALTFDCLQRRDAAGSYTTPQAMLSDYYAAINAQNFARAYSLWAAPQQTYAQFAAGFADTSEVVMFSGITQWNPHFTAEAAALPVVLLGYHTDGSVVAFEGCLRVANTTTPTRWGLLGADLRPMPIVYMPGQAEVVARLAQPCY